MDNRTKKYMQENSIKEKFRNISDEEIISILRMRVHYRPEAIEAVVEEAIERGIINNTEDLLSNKFSVQPLPPRSLFPLGTDKKSTFAIFKSLCRVFYGLGLLPFIHSVFSFVAGNYSTGSISLIVALTVFSMVYQVDRKMNLFALKFLLFLNVPLIAFSTYIIYTASFFAAIDIFAICMVVLVTLYVSLYLRKLFFYFSE